MRGAPPPDKKLLEHQFVFACVWAFGGCMLVDKVSDYRTQFSKWWISEYKNVQFPEKVDPPLHIALLCSRLRILASQFTSFIFQTFQHVYPPLSSLDFRLPASLLSDVEHSSCTPFGVAANATHPGATFVDHSWCFADAAPQLRSAAQLCGKM